MGNDRPPIPAAVLDAFYECYDMARAGSDGIYVQTSYAKFDARLRIVRERLYAAVYNWAAQESACMRPARPSVLRSPRCYPKIN